MFKQLFLKTLSLSAHRKVTLKLLEERRRVLDAEIAHKKVRAEKRAQSSPDSCLWSTPLVG